MTIQTDGNMVRLAGRCGVDEAEALLSALLSGAATIDLSDCEHLHAAIVQVLMATRPVMIGSPAPFLEAWVIPAIDRAHDQSGDAILS